MRTRFSHFGGGSKATMRKTPEEPPGRSSLVVKLHLNIFTAEPSVVNLHTGEALVEVHWRDCLIVRLIVRLIMRFVSF